MNYRFISIIFTTGFPFAIPDDPIEEFRARLTPSLQAMLNTSSYRACRSSTGSRGVTCPGFSLGDGCLRHFLWCREDFTVSCGDHGLTSNNDLFCGNKR